MKHQVVFRLSATTGAAGWLSTPASTGFTDQSLSTLEHRGGGGAGARLALITNTFHFLHGGNWFFANDTSFPIGSISARGQRGLVWIVRRVWYDYSIRTYSPCTCSPFLVTFSVTSEIKQRGKNEDKMTCQGAWGRWKGYGKMKR